MTGIAELLNGPESCMIPDFPSPIIHGTLILTSSGNDILYCGGSYQVWPDSTHKECYKLDVAHQVWAHHSTLTEGKKFFITLQGDIYSKVSNISAGLSNILILIFPKNLLGTYWKI